MTNPIVVSITDDLLAELEQLAGKATPGRWCTDGMNWVCAQDSDQLNNGFVLAICEGPDELKNVEYIARANPATILALLQHVRELRVDNEALAVSLNRSNEANELYAQQPKQSRAEEMAAMGWLSEMRFAAGDDGKLMLPQLAMHIALLRRDAERYRWLRGNERNGIIVVRDYKSDLVNENLDATIDTARSATNEDKQ